MTESSQEIPKAKRFRILAWAMLAAALIFAAFALGAYRLLGEDGPMFAAPLALVAAVDFGAFLYFRKKARGKDGESPIERY